MERAGIYDTDDYTRTHDCINTRVITLYGPQQVGFSPPIFCVCAHPRTLSSCLFGRHAGDGGSVVYNYTPSTLCLSVVRLVWMKYFITMYRQLWVLVQVLVEPRGDRLADLAGLFPVPAIMNGCFDSLDWYEIGNMQRVNEAMTNSPNTTTPPFAVVWKNGSRACL